MKTYIVYLVLIFSATALMAGPGSPPAATPIDGGLSLLLLAGGAYGVRKVLKNRK